MYQKQVLSASLMLLATLGCLGEGNHPKYQWQKVSDGIYLHSAVDPLAGPLDGNSVAIVTAAEVFVVDTHINPAAARAMIKMIGQVTDKPVTHIINTHWHDDHTNGNHAYRDAFPDAKIIAHSATLAALKKEWPVMEEQRKVAYADVTPDKILAAAAAIEDPNQAIGYRVYAGYVAALKPELGSMELVYPDTVFDDELVLVSGGRRIVVEWLGPGNTDGDVVVRLPDDELLIAGDLLVAPVPFASIRPWLTGLSLWSG